MLALVLLVCVCSAAGEEYLAEGYPPMPAGPPKHLPQFDAAGYPGFRVLFRSGECDADDVGIPATRINTKKVCYSCFRIPSLTRNPKTGTLYAFAEARRRPLHVYHFGLTIDASPSCPDLPDTHVAFKRSTDGGTTWSSLRILNDVPSMFQIQASPVVDANGTLTVLFQTGTQWPGTVQQMVSTDDGITFSKPVPAVRAPGNRAVVLSTNGARGHMLMNGSSVRLLFPGQYGSLYSDDHGATWSTGPTPKGGMGEAAITRCTLGEACNGRKFVMVNRCEARANPLMVCRNMAFSADGVHWDPPVEMNITRFAETSAAPGAVGVPGALIMSHNGNKVKANGRLGSLAEDLLYTENGKDWKLLKGLWPLSGGYSTLAELETDKDGAALRYGTLFEAAGLMEDKDYLIFMNFTWTKPDPARAEEPMLV